MVLFEKCFEVNANIFQLKEDGSAQSIYKSRCHFKDTMHLNLYEHHLSDISNFNAYATKYQCQTCERHFSHVNSMQRHQRICKGKTVHEFLGGFYTAPKTIFDKLEGYDVYVQVKDLLFPWFLIYDFEAMLVPVQCEKLSWTAQYQPVSVSICSNVNGFTSPHCIVTPWSTTWWST
jgi:hypothetical protein